MSARYLKRLAAEPPFRLLSRMLVRAFAKSAETRARWGADDYAAYQVGIVGAAKEAQSEGVQEISVVEFGVASGRGLLAMERHARAAESLTSVRIRVVGFDSGEGLPPLGGYRDHPDYWQRGDFPMDFGKLTRQLEQRRTRLVIGNLADTVPAFLEEGAFPPLGFISFDVDLYSSTKDALAILRGSKRRMLRRTLLYFDDVNNFVSHSWAGERLAVTEFNQASEYVKIDRWHGIRADKPFPEWQFWDNLMIAHDVQAIDKFVLNRSTRVL